MTSVHWSGNNLVLNNGNLEVDGNVSSKLKLVGESNEKCRSIQEIYDSIPITLFDCINLEKIVSGSRLNVSNMEIFAPGDGNVSGTGFYYLTFPFSSFFRIDSSTNPYLKFTNESFNYVTNDDYSILNFEYFFKFNIVFFYDGEINDKFQEMIKNNLKIYAQIKIGKNDTQFGIPLASSIGLRKIWKSSETGELSENEIGTSPVFSVAGSINLTDKYSGIKFIITIDKNILDSFIEENSGSFDKIHYSNDIEGSGQFFAVKILAKNK